MIVKISIEFPKVDIRERGMILKYSNTTIYFRWKGKGNKYLFRITKDYFEIGA